MRLHALNGSVRLAAWGGFLLVVQFAALPLLLGCLVVTALCGADVRRHWHRLLRRSRWLLSMLAVSLALVTPGEYLAAGLPLTDAGLQAALLQVLRLMAMLGAVALLLATTPVEALVGGLLGLLPQRPAPIARFSQRAALRLGLVLRLAAASETRPWRQWLDDAPDDSEPIAPVTVNVPDWRAIDRFSILLLASVVLLFILLAPQGG